MASSIGSRLTTIAKRLRDLAQDVEDLAKELQSESEGQHRRPKARDVAIDDALVERLKNLGRDEAQKELSQLGHKELGRIVRALGGSSEETKRSKDAITERVLYRLFDYSTRHRLLKGESDE